MLGVKEIIEQPCRGREKGAHSQCTEEVVLMLIRADWLTGHLVGTSVVCTECDMLMGGGTETESKVRRCARVKAASSQTFDTKICQ